MADGHRENYRRFFDRGQKIGKGFQKTQTHPSHVKNLTRPQGQFLRYSRALLSRILEDLCNLLAKFLLN